MFKRKNIIGLFSLCLFIVFHCPLLALADPAEEVLNRATLVLEAVKKNKSDDLHYLWNSLTKFVGEDLKSEEFFQQRKEQTIQLLLDDHKQIEVLKKNLGSQGTFSLRSNLGKLVNDPQQKMPGLMEEAVILLNEVNSFDGLAPDVQMLQPKSETHHVILTVALLYFNFNLKSLDTSLASKNLKVNYIESFPKEILPEGYNVSDLPKFFWTDDKDNLMLMMPNCGYVFGGGNDLDFKGQCKGTDCSAFVSYCVQCPLRLSTYHLELIYRYLKKSPLQEQQKDLEAQKVVDEIISQGIFLAIDVNPQQEEGRIRPGDLVVWRNKDGKSGHVAIFKGWSENAEYEEFIGIDATRTNDGVVNGISERVFKLVNGDFNTLVLRRK